LALEQIDIHAAQGVHVDLAHVVDLGQGRGTEHQGSTFRDEGQGRAHGRDASSRSINGRRSPGRSITAYAPAASSSCTGRKPHEPPTGTRPARRAVTTSTAESPR